MHEIIIFDHNQNNYVVIKEYIIKAAVCRVPIDGIYEPYNCLYPTIIMRGNEYDVIKAVIESALYIRAVPAYLILSFFFAPLRIIMWE